MRRRLCRLVCGPVALTIYVAAAFALGALVMISPSGVKITFWTATVWFIVALVAFHFLLSLKANETTPNELRALEYVYIIIGLLGALGFADVQTILLEGQIPSWMEGFAEIQPVTHLCESQEERSPRQREIECSAESTLRELLQHYDRDRARKFLVSARGMESEPFYPRIKEIVEFVRDMDKTMEQQVFQYTVDPKSASWLTFRIFGFYMILVGVAIKFAKTSAEIFGWHRRSEIHINQR